ncbi:MAG: putative dehydrogenase [Verrucomicrobiales bacterium]|jgi:predicted dehydrogenase
MADMTGVLRWGVLGTGFISHSVIEAIEQSPGSSVEIIGGRNAERVAEFAVQYGIDRSSTDMVAVVEDPSIDVVYVGLPNHVHHEIAIASAVAGKAVLSEKSLTTTMEAAHELVDGVRSAGTFFVEGLMYLAHPLLSTFVQVLTDGRLGTIRSIRGSYAANIADLVNPQGMGTLYNLGCYPVSLLQLVMQACFGDDAFHERTLKSVGNLSDSDGTVVDAACVVRFGNGVLATLQSSDSYGNGSEFAVGGDRGTLRFETNPWLPLGGENVIIWDPFEGGVERIVVHDEHDAFFHQIQMVERRVAAGGLEAERPSPRLSDSIEIMEMLTDWEAQCR